MAGDGGEERHDLSTAVAEAVPFCIKQLGQTKHNLPSWGDYSATADSKRKPKSITHFNKKAFCQKILLAEADVLEDCRL